MVTVRRSCIYIWIEYSWEVGGGGRLNKREEEAFLVFLNVYLELGSDVRKLFVHLSYLFIDLCI